jgi:hypothetical protein
MDILVKLGNGRSDIPGLMPPHGIVHSKEGKISYYKIWFPTGRYHVQETYDGKVQCSRWGIDLPVTEADMFYYKIMKAKATKKVDFLRSLLRKWRSLAAAKSKK